MRLDATACDLFGGGALAASPSGTTPPCLPEVGVNLANLVCSQPRRNIRVWMSSGVNDGLAYRPAAVINNMILGSLAANNIDLANALKANDYDFREAW